MDKISKIYISSEMFIEIKLLQFCISNPVASVVYMPGFQLQMVGYDVSWAAFNVIEVMSSSKFTFKVRTYSLQHGTALVRSKQWFLLHAKNI